MNSIANWKILENLLSNTVIQTGKQISTLYPHAVMVLHALIISYLQRNILLTGLLVLILCQSIFHIEAKLF